VEASDAGDRMTWWNASLAAEDEKRTLHVQQHGWTVIR
jgi:very-short-patch-repair endonuclease